jgi:proline iminopeptidase
VKPLYPEIEPDDQGMLDVGDGNRIAWEVCGNPDGKPAVALHGGPGSGRSTWARRYFDPAAFRIILFDQRGCGASTPHAGDTETDLAVNTTAHLLRDMERLREHLGVERWLVFGHSWGCTLGLAYAERHPGRVSALVLVGVTMTRRSEIDWLYRGLAPIFPEQWTRFREGVPEGARDGDLVAAYYGLLNDPDPAVHEKAARDWHDWEAASITVDPDAAPPQRWSDPRFRLARARIVTHYFHHDGWLEDGALLKGAGALAGIPGVMVQGRLDLEAPLATAWELARAWPDGDLVVVPHAGHSDSDAGMAEAITAATDRFAGVRLK